MAKLLRVGVIGIGTIGESHANLLANGQIKGACLAAIASSKIANSKKFTQAEYFSSGTGLIASGQVDAVIIATPHKVHAECVNAALALGIHVLVEKPLAADVLTCRQMLDTANTPQTIKLVFAAMFNQRTDSAHINIRQLIQQGLLGQLRRIQWTCTDWYRSQHYYNSSDWRATWQGEGGGILINQCAHNLDLWQWFFGMPKKVRAFCRLGRYHNIEVEDEVTAYLEYEDGCSGIFISSTGESPGTNRLEVVGELGRLLYENGQLSLLRNEVAMSEFSQSSQSFFDKPNTKETLFTLQAVADQHQHLIQNFVDTINGGAQLIADARDGIRSVELANAMLYSSLNEKSVTLPFDTSLYAQRIEDLILKSEDVSPF